MDLTVVVLGLAGLLLFLVLRKKRADTAVVGEGERAFLRLDKVEAVVTVSGLLQCPPSDVTVSHSVVDNFGEDGGQNRCKVVLVEADGIFVVYTENPNPKYSRYLIKGKVLPYARVKLTLGYNSDYYWNLTRR